MRRSQITAISGTAIALAILIGCASDSTGPGAGIVSLAFSTITSRAAALIANGVDTTTITVTPKDANGAPITLASKAVSITAQRGSLGDATQNSDGTFSALLTAPDTIGNDEIFATIKGQLLHRSLTLPINPGPPAVATSTLGASSPRILADGKSATDIFLTPRDAQGNLITDVAVTMTTTRGTLSPVVAEASSPWDYGDDGNYFATLTSTTSVDSALVSVQIAGKPFGAPIVVQFVLQP